MRRPPVALDTKTDGTSTRVAWSPIHSWRCEETLFTAPRRGGVVTADGAHEDEAPFDVVRHHHADRARVLHALDLVCKVGVRQRAGGVVARPALDKHNLAGEGGGLAEAVGAVSSRFYAVSAGVVAEGVGEAN